MRSVIAASGPIPPARQGGDIPAHLLGATEINDGEGLITLVVPCYVEATRRTRDPLLARVSLIPDLVPPHVSLDVHLDQSSHVRALVECGDGALLEVSRWVWAMPSEV
jgi:predicted secreted protein